jgi:hypothetical protein
MVLEIVEKDKQGKERVKETKIFVGEKEIRLRFTMPMWYRMEREICVLDDVYTMMHERDRFEPDKVPALIAMMSGDVITPKELIREADPSTMKALMNEAQRVMAEAITMKEKKYDDDSVHDETLEEIEKKEPRAD